MKKIISILTPTFNEQDNIAELSRQIESQMQNLDYDYEQIIIDNNSTDKTQNIIRNLCKKNKNIKAIFNTKNFGHVRSPTYGFLQCNGDAIIAIASDFQEPPELIPKLIKKWEEGSNVVLLKRISTKENFFKELLKSCFYKLLNSISETKLINHTTGSGIFDKKFLEQIKKINEPYPYFRGLITEVTDKIETLEFDQPKRTYGESKSSFYVLYDLAMNGIIKHSKIPLRFITIFGFFMSGISLFIGLFFFFYKILYWDSFQVGLAPVAIGLFFGLSFMIFMLGIIGEYIGFTLTQVRNLPLVWEKERINFD